MKSSATSLLIVFCVLFSSVPNMGQSCTCIPSPPSGNTTCERGQIAVCGVDGDGVCAGRCVGAISTAISERELRVEDTSRKLAEKAGVVNTDAVLHGTGGPAIPLDAAGLAALESKMSQLEKELSAHESVLRARGFTPSIWPVDGKLESGFGGRRNPFGGSGYEFHDGQDIDAPLGAPIVAGAKGTVTFVGWQHGYGRLIVIDHGGGLTTRYGHLSEFDIEPGEEVARGQFIGRVGSTGRSTGPQLHYEVRINDDPVNPLQYLMTSTKP